MAIFEHIKIITLFILALFAIFLFTKKSGNRLANYALGSIYGFQALEKLNSTFYRFPEFWMNDYPWVFYTTETTFFLWGPAIYFFFRSAFDYDFKLNKQHLWHTLPAVLHTGFLTFKFHMHSNAVKTDLLQHGAMSIEEDFVIHLLRNTSVVVYLVICVWLWKKHKMNKQVESGKSWMPFFLVVFCLVEFIQILHFVDLETRTYNTYIYNFTSTLWFVVALSTLFKALRDPFFTSSEKPKTKNKIEPKKALIPDKESEEIFNKIKGHIIEGENYKDLEMSVQKLAAAINSTPKKTSWVINDRFNMGFSDFINSYRIEAASHLLINDNEKTIIEIAYEVGFNSKATFNRVFSKLKETSPTQFRNVRRKVN